MAFPWKFLDGASRGRLSGATLLLAAAIELLNIFLRFGLDLEATRDTAFIARFTGGLRIHHGYVGLLGLILAAVLLRPGRWRNLALLVMGAIFLSDLLHHFVVLWIVVGSPQFDLLYPT